MNFKDMFNEFLILSNNLRKGYIQSISARKENWKDGISFFSESIPELYQVIYDRVIGTKREIENESHIDFIPGYRLIHIDELCMEKESLDKITQSYDISDFDLIVPLLANYSSDYICYLKSKGGAERIGFISHDNQGIFVMHNSIEKFFETICEFYKRQVYFIDNDGFLNSDYSLECEVGVEINVGVEYWRE